MAHPVLLLHPQPCGAEFSIPRIGDNILHQTNTLLPLGFCKEVTCSTVHHQCSCTQTTPWLSSCYRPHRRDWFLYSSLCSYHWGEA